MSRDDVAFYGFTPVPRDPDVLFKDHPTASGPNPKQELVVASDFPLPDSSVVRAVKDFVKAELDEQTYNHSHRVYIYGTALVKTHFPSWLYDSETYYLACLLHDIGTANRFLASTKMSFEFKGAIVARDLILQQGGPEDQADSVCDAIIRHQDIFVKGGNITMIGQILQLATILDNVGLRANLIHPRLIETTTAAFPRKGWSEHFARVIEKELTLKPWCHTSTFEQPNWKEGVQSNFATDVRGNDVMKPFD
ncbi:cyanamide hydratase [Laetiporus sulphureus 93-53]|uniref:Cyanamide hydratase n=1 Tax=Laetiporus sulphureus 93-53 TaxID=1314785 RepID=A0A165FLE3_9APHY|nr:cyanamide hydratase [Laetiporus sulphureus 93-53]KZT09145.1 cyanamide hydratase [Laetiporus sulphureus 93-53]